MKTFFLSIIFMMGLSNMHGQYLDGPGLVARLLERNEVSRAYSETVRTTTAYGKTTPTTVLEELSKTNLNFNDFTSAGINPLKYRNTCSSYLNPFKRKACQNKVNYLLGAHKEIVNLMRVSTSNKINQGVKELIGEKYTSITNKILLELEQVKNEAGRNILSRILITN